MPGENREKIYFFTENLLMRVLGKKKMQTIEEIKKYTPPRLHTGSEWYISFKAFDPVVGKLRLKRIKINHVKSVTERRKYAKDLIMRFSEKLIQGWNPWIEAEHGNSYLTFIDVLDAYRRFIDKMHRDNQYRSETHTCYVSYCRNMENYNKESRAPIYYIYQFDRDFCVRFLEEVYIGRDNTAFTRDNYLSFLKSFSQFCLNQNYLKVNPTDAISTLGKRSKKKIRTLIPEHDLNRITDLLERENKYYLLASYILYYCFIRPKEMSQLRLNNFSLAKQTIFIPDEISKNKKDAIITLPAKVIHLMLDLKIFDNPTEYYLFSDGFKPGSNQRTEKQFRDYWSHHVRKPLKFPDKYKFYSLKDTGITNMLRHYDVLSVRDQARHSSILMTDIYTPHDIMQANELIKNYEGKF